MLPLHKIEFTLWLKVTDKACEMTIFSIPTTYNMCRTILCAKLPITLVDCTANRLLFKLHVFLLIFYPDKVTFKVKLAIIETRVFHNSCVIVEYLSYIYVVSYLV